VLTNVKFITDAHGTKTAAILEIHDFEKIMEDLEELEDIRAYDAAKASGDAEIPFDEAIKEIEQRHQ
jgi:hypothetical protein